MAIEQRIKFFRNRKGMTQKQLGEILGFLGKTSDVRMAQLFEVSTHAFTVPNLDSYIGLMHTLFALEDIYGLKIREIDGEVCLCLDKTTAGKHFFEVASLLLFSIWTVKMMSLSLSSAYCMPLHKTMSINQ